MGRWRSKTGKFQWVQRQVFISLNIKHCSYWPSISQFWTTHGLIFLTSLSPSGYQHVLLAFLLLLKVTIIFKYNLNQEGAKGSCHHFKLINPPLMLTGIEMMMHSLSWSKTRISHFNLTWRNKQRPLNREKNLVGEGTHKGGTLTVELMKFTQRQKFSSRFATFQ